MQDVIIAENISKKYYPFSNTILQKNNTLVDHFEKQLARILKKPDPTQYLSDTNTTYSNEPFYALKNISFKVRQGEAIGIIGKNGAGKSTLLKIMSRITSPSEGHLFIKGALSSIIEVGTGFHHELSGRENIYLNGMLHGINRKTVDTYLAQIIEFADLGRFIDVPIKRYSSGMHLRLAFSIIAHLPSEIMLLDEVLAVGDTPFQEKCLKKIESIVHDEQRTVFLVSHNLTAIKRFCSRCLLIADGELRKDSSNVAECLNFYQELCNTNHAEINT
jgi:ABC-type polysaccharide/polyol phosphate transport system ATPase subunit